MRNQDWRDDWPKPFDDCTHCADLADRITDAQREVDRLEARVNEEGAVLDDLVGDLHEHTGDEAAHELQKAVALYREAEARGQTRIPGIDAMRTSA